MNNPKLLKDRWNAIYKTGKKYKDEPPILFVKTILSTLKKMNLMNGKGLYIGCGNGRNFIPLVEKGLDLFGIDISDEAIRQIIKRKPELTERLTVTSFLEFKPQQLFDYVISIQVFHHGDYKTVMENFQKVADILKPKGLFFLKDRSTGTTTTFTYKILEETALGGFTVRFMNGPKKNLEIHFLSHNELETLPKLGLYPIITPYETIIKYTDTKKRQLVHWEGIWQK